MGERLSRVTNTDRRLFDKVLKTVPRMLTFISGWRSQDRDQALIKHRDPMRRAVFFVENDSRFAEYLPESPVIDVWRNGPVNFLLGEDPDTVVRRNHATERELFHRAITHVLLTGADAQLIITYDAVQYLYRLLPALRASGALLAADERLDAPAGDRVLFTRGGSFSWKDHVLESQTALLNSAEVIDAGIVPDEEEGSLDF